MIEIPEDYERNLKENLQDLARRLKQRSYRPWPSLRREIPKGEGKTRPLGLPAVEDKLVQRALAAILERVYEEDFYSFSFGFRPGRSCHDALKELSRAIGTKKVEWIVDADIKGFFDNVDHDWLMKMVAHRVKDPKVLWLIRASDHRFSGNEREFDTRLVEAMGWVNDRARR